MYLIMSMLVKHFFDRIFTKGISNWYMDNYLSKLSKNEDLNSNFDHLLITKKMKTLKLILYIKKINL